MSVAAPAAGREALRQWKGRRVRHAVFRIAEGGVPGLCDTPLGTGRALVHPPLCLPSGVLLAKCLQLALAA